MTDEQAIKKAIERLVAQAARSILSWRQAHERACGAVALVRGLLVMTQEGDVAQAEMRALYNWLTEFSDWLAQREKEAQLSLTSLQDHAPIEHANQPPALH